MAGRSAPTVVPLKIQGIPPPIRFVSGGIIHEEAHVVSEEGHNNYEMDKWIRPTIPGQEPANWFAEDVIEVTRYEE